MEHQCSTFRKQKYLHNLLTTVTQHNSQSALHINNDDVRCFALEVLRFFEIDTDEVIIHFVSEEKIKVLHGLFFSTTKTTDCISFPMDGNNKNISGSNHTLGECFINPQEAINYLPEDPYEELSRYIIHCILHFIGHEDYNEEDKKAMHNLENLALSHAKEKKVLLSNPHPLYT